jgi:16S rRNA C967 or C1407 C5-methylase (RsmB/RsmF family)/NOL1/NOP2/fmu family ribosome biogenesis protein
MHHLPESFLQALEGIPGYNREAFIACHEAPAEWPAVRLNPAKQHASVAGAFLPGLPATLFQGQAESFRPMALPWCGDGYVLNGRPPFVFDPLFHAGLYYVQEASSMFLHHAWRCLCADMERARVLDLCAAPGGKSTLLASQQETGLLVSNELIRTRVPVLYENIVKWGLPHLFVSNQDPKDFQALPGFFDAMLVDAPCSGSGLFRREPQAIREWSPANVTLCSQRQQRILADALPALREGGILFYATCSYSREEDEDICDWLLKDQEMESMQIPLPGSWGVVETLSSAQQAYGYRFYPHLLKGEGFFLAAFRKKKGIRHWTTAAKKLTPVLANQESILRTWVSENWDLEFFQQQDACMAVPAACVQDLVDLSAACRLRKSGLRVGTFAHWDFNPDHELAMSVCLRSPVPLIALDLPDAIRYLRKDALGEIAPERGWNIVQYEGSSLGFAKGLPNRINNYYPSEWRIRKEY